MSYELRNPQRIQKDICEIETKQPDFARIKHIEGDTLKSFHAEIDGPSETPYFTGQFLINIYMPTNFPIDPPKFRMVTKVWHPNISTNGKICVDILGDKWKPGMTLLELLEGMQGLLRAPNPDSPLNLDAAAMMKLVDKTMYLSTCVAYTYTFAYGQISNPVIEEKISVLMSFNISREDALTRLAANKLDGQRVVNLYNL